jgi:SAM-dependent methyltransferase
MHVVLHSKLQHLFENSIGSVRKQLQDTGFGKEVIQNNISRLQRLVEKISWKESRSPWIDYGSEHCYAEEDRLTKEAFLRRAAGTKRWPMAWDLGCNVGIYSRVLAEYADYVVAMDADHLAVDQLYRNLSQNQTKTILPLVVNLADPSPSLGWGGQERKDLLNRGAPDLTLCLALLHHMVIQANIPLISFMDWLRSLGSALVIEFVSREDPMVQRLLRNKADEYADYNLEYFEEVLSNRFRIIFKEELSCGTRSLYFAEPHFG